ncbi:MAG: TIGR02099 family protein [Herminiimonas sp.]|nr:TIGR02099 family protein [Herminiimonas sp.]
MPTDASTPTQASGLGPACMRAAMTGFRLAHTSLWRLLCLLGRLLVIVYFLFCLSFLILRYAVLPNIGHYKPQVEQVAADAIGQPLTIGRIDAGWSRFTPRLTLTDVVIRHRNGDVALQLPRVTAGLSWWSVVVGGLRLDALEIERPDLDIQRDRNGRLFVAGIYIDTGKSGDGKGADWVLSQRRIVIRDGRVRWNDLQRGAPELVLEKLNVRLDNQWQSHAFSLFATPPALLAAPLELRGRFVHPAFSGRISDVTQWKGTLYADVSSPALAGANAYVDLPIALTRGSGSVRSWLSVDHQKVVDLTADLHLADVSARLAPDLPLLELAAVDGRISVQDGMSIDAKTASAASAVSTAAGAGFFGVSGHAIALTNFSMRTQDGLSLPTTTIKEKFTAARPGVPEQMAFEAQLLDLETLSSFVERLPLPAAQRRMLQDFSPRGRLQNFNARWQGAYPDIASYAVRGNFSNLALNAQPARPARPKSASLPAQAALPAIPGFDNLTGSIYASDRGGAFNLASSALKLELPGYFANPTIALDQLDMQATWRFKANDQLLLEVRKMQVAQQGVRATFSGTHLMPLRGQRGKPLGTIDLSGTISGLDIARIDDFLPLATPDSLRAWLSGALVGGRLNDAALRLKGDLAGFPFHTVAAPGKSALPAGEFSVRGRIENGKLNVAPGRLGKDGKMPLWPLIEDIQGTIVFDRTRMEIDAASAKIHNVGLTAVKAVIPDLLAPDKVLGIDGTAAGALQELTGFVNDSPVVDWIGRFTEDTRATGNARLGLKLQLPLARMLETKVQGSLQLVANDVILQSEIPALLQASGKLDFTEKGVTLNAMKASFVGGPVVVSGGSQRDGAIVIKAEGSVSSDGLRRAYPSPAMLRLADRVAGTARYAATISVRKKHLEIVIDSTLQGLALDLPVPLRKAANETLPLKFEIVGMPGDEALGLNDELRIALGSAVSARYLRHKGVEKGAAWRVVRGGIGVNVPAPQPDGGVSVNASLKTLNIDAWRSAIAIIGGSERPKAAGAASTLALEQSGAGGGTTLASPGSPPAAEPAGLNQYIEPEVLAARATELIIAGKKLDNVVVGASHQKGVWQANIDAAQASGYVTWNESPSGAGLGRVTARLSSLIIPKTAATDVTEILEGKGATAQIPALDIVASNFELLGKKMGRLELIAANNARATLVREWQINKLLITNADAELKAVGKWSTTSGDNLTNLAYTLDIANAGKLLERFGFANVLKGGKGRLEGDITWQGLPFALDVPTLSGELRIDLAAGQFLKVDPGAAKLLGVLSLQSLPRRLTLDFRDVFSEGFAFDGITGSAIISRGAARTDNFKMRSVNATVIMDGTADIDKETQNLHVAVIPEINVGTASVVYALAVNPIIGLGSFLAQLFLRDPLMKAFTFEYRITGPWKDPQVVKVDRNGVPIPGKIAPQATSAGMP